MNSDIINAEIREVVKLIMNSVACVKIYLFGSYAYGTPNNTSDFDIYVVLPNDSPRLLDVRRVIYKNLIGKKTLRSVDVMANYEKDFAELSGLPSLERKIAREGVLLYGQE
ncbi:nucleotidyltransferase [Synergistales bacterium]|nr:nucleotidyltransferase [Synergistales bacterium]